MYESGSSSSQYESLAIATSSKADCAFFGMRPKLRSHASHFIFANLFSPKIELAIRRDP
jgi:hypothetical protein